MSFHQDHEIAEIGHAVEVPHRILACSSQAADFIGFLGGNELGAKEPDMSLAFSHVGRHPPDGFHDQ